MDFPLLQFAAQAFASLTGAVIGATAAFYFGHRLYKIQKREEEKASFFHALSVLYFFKIRMDNLDKEIISPRFADAAHVEKNLIASLKIFQGTNGIRSLSSILFANDIHLPFSIEKIGFIANHSPPLIVLISMLNNNLVNTEALIKKMNDHIEYMTRKTNDVKLKDLRILVNLNRSLCEYSKIIVMLSSKSLDELEEWGKLKYKEEIAHTLTLLKRIDAPTENGEVFVNWDDFKQKS